MQVYIGMVLHEQIINAYRFSSTLKEIKHLLTAHSEEIVASVSENMIVIRPLYSTYEVCIPQNNKFFHTSYFRVQISESTAENIKKFLEVCWECFAILKENFPSKITLYQEQLDSVLDYDSVSFSREILRRQINHIQNRSESVDILKHDELEDLVYVLESSYKSGNLKGMKVCLGILNSRLCPPCLLINLPAAAQEIISTIAQFDSGEKPQYINKEEISNHVGFSNYKEVQILAVAISSRLVSLKPDSAFRHDELNSGRQVFYHNASGVERTQKGVLIESAVNEGMDLIKGSTKSVESLLNFDEPSLVRSFVFQLKESKDIERITFILNTITSKHLDKIDRLNNAKFHLAVDAIMDKYCKGELGIDSSTVTKYCIFHNRLLKFICIIIKDETLIADLFKRGFPAKFAQIIEEGVLNITQNIVNADQKEAYERENFMKMTVKLLDRLAVFHNSRLALQEAVTHILQILNSYLGFSGYFCEADLEAFGKDVKEFYLGMKKLELKAIDCLAAEKQLKGEAMVKGDEYSVEEKAKTKKSMAHRTRSDKENKKYF